MNRRGRPRWPDVLTPREWLVLELLREGLTNREIAERMGISLSGAKHHVSEIITKLGVASREEAAMWQREPEVSRRWGFAPIAALKGWWTEAMAGWTPKAVLAGVVAFGVLGGAAVLTQVGDSEAGQTLSSGLAPTPTPRPDPCEGRPENECISLPVEKVQLASLDEAAEYTSFIPVLPAYIPQGYERASLTYIWPGEIPEHLREQFHPKGPLAPSEALYAQYKRPNTNDVLLVNQGWGISRKGSIPLEAAPEHLHGSVTIGDREVFWYKGQAVWEDAEDRYGMRYQRPSGQWEETSNILVFWESYGPSMGMGWEIDPDGTRRDFELRGRAYAYLIRSESLSLEEMLKIAASVP